MELHVIVDSAIGMDLTSPFTIVSGLSHSSAHGELQDICQDVDGVLLSAINWAALGPFINGWLVLAQCVQGSEVAIVYLMEAERLIDANDVDMEWCEKNISNEECRTAALELLKTKQRRISNDWN
jgi:hypothetical protein